MSDFIVEVIESSNNNIEIINDADTSNLEVSTQITNLDIINTEKLLASDFPDFYHTKIVDFNSAVSGLLPTESPINIEDVQDIIGLSGIIGGTGIKVSYNDSTGYTFIDTSGLGIGTSILNLGSTYQSLIGLSMISGVSINSPTVLVNCRIDGGTP